MAILFSRCSIQNKTHIDFNNQLKDTREHNILIYSNYYGGAGVGVGDINNDGLQDLFFCRESGCRQNSTSIKAIWSLRISRRKQE